MGFPQDLPWTPTGTTLGEGGQGVVHLVTRKGDPDGPKYALKELRNVESVQAQERFKLEIKVVNLITHPAIIRVIDHSKDEDEFLYYVMEYHEGAELLANVIYSQPTNPFHGNALRSLDLYQRIISAISACERNEPRVVHRDINPKNILLLRDGSIRLIDFGICHFEDGNMLTLTDEDVGTRNYTPPECESGGDSKIDVRSDIYAASKVLWSAITSRRAFSREEHVFKGDSMNKRFPDKTETWHLTRIFENTIRKEPSDRFSDTDKVFELLHEVRYAIEKGFPPLEDVGSRCPSCGGRAFSDLREAHGLFGHVSQRSFSAVQCSRCGLVILRNKTILSKRIEKIENLQ